MAAFDAVGAGGTSTTTAGLTYQVSIGAGDTALVVSVTGLIFGAGIASLTTRTVKIGLTPLILLGATDCNNTVGSGWVEMWGLLGPPIGNNQNINIVENDSGFPSTIYSDATTYTGVTNFGTPVVNSGSGTLLTAGSIVSSVGSMVVSAQGAYNAAITKTGSGVSRYNQPPVAGSAVSLLIQDIAGAPTVALTSTAGSATPWGVVSINLIGGTQWHVNASPTAMTVARSASASFVGRAWTVNASLAMTTTATAIGAGQHLGPALRYVGRVPDTNSVLSTASYAQIEDNATLVTPTYISQQMSIASADLVTEDWINEQVANHSTQAQVTAALTAYTPNSALGAHSGVAQLDSNDTIPSGQLPTLVTNSLAVNYDAVTQGTVWLPTGNSVTTANNTIGAVPLAQVTIPNPGYPWVPMPFALVQAQAGGTPSVTRLAGNNNFGFLTVTPVGASTPIYAAGVCTDDTLPNYYLCLPFGAGTGGTMTPQTQPPIVGAATLLLSGCSWSGTAYTFWGTGLTFYCLVLPAVGG